MKHDPRRVLEILLDELTQVFHLSPEQVGRCRQQLAEWLRPRWPVLFLATGEEPLSEATLESFRTLTALGIDATLVRSHSFAQVGSAQVLRAQLGSVSLLDNVSAGEICCLPERFPLLCVLALSSNTVIKTILGLRDATPPRVLRAFLERGRPVVAVGLPPQRVNVDEDRAVFWGLPLAVRQWLAEGYRTFEQWGVEFVEAERLVEAVRQRLFGVPARPATIGQAAAAPAPTTGRVFITTDDIRAARSRGDRRIAVSPNTSVTDEAREFAARWGILLIE